MQENVGSLRPIVPDKLGMLHPARRRNWTPREPSKLRHTRWAWRGPINATRKPATRPFLRFVLFTVISFCTVSSFNEAKDYIGGWAGVK